MHQTSDTGDDAAGEPGGPFPARVPVSVLARVAAIERRTGELAAALRPAADLPLHDPETGAIRTDWDMLSAWLPVTWRHEAIALARAEGASVDFLQMVRWIDVPAGAVRSLDDLVDRMAALDLLGAFSWSGAPEFPVRPGGDDLVRLAGLTRRYSDPDRPIPQSLRGFVRDGGSVVAEVGDAHAEHAGRPGVGLLLAGRAVHALLRHADSALQADWRSGRLAALLAPALGRRFAAHPCPLLFVAFGLAAESGRISGVISGADPAARDPEDWDLLWLGAVERGLEAAERRVQALRDLRLAWLRAGYRGGSARGRKAGERERMLMLFCHSPRVATGRAAELLGLSMSQSWRRLEGLHEVGLVRRAAGISGIRLWKAPSVEELP